jgi:hypothetical protein
VHAQHELGTVADVADARVHADPVRRNAVERGVDGVVEQVARDRDEIARIRDPGRDVRAVGHRELHAPFSGLRGLADDERRQLGHLDGPQYGVGELLRDRQLLGRVGEGLVGAAQLDQRDDGVQLVGGLVGLRVE